MAGGFQDFEWTVKMQHAENAFSKTRQVTAINYAEAADKAMRALRGAGYDDGDFVVTSVARGRAV